MFRGTRSIYLLAATLYLVGAWLHIPYGGGHIYSDIVTVFQTRECSSACELPIPYLQTFVEYPVIASSFMYVMGILGNSLAGNLLDDYYLLSVIFLGIPTFLLIRELIILSRLMGVASGRVTRFLVITPTFLIMLLLSWYAIGVYLSVFAMRKFLEGRLVQSGALLGLSAATNLVTGVPAVGLLIAAKGRKSRATFTTAIAASYLVVNAPFVLINPNSWFAFWNYHSSWYIEGSWMELFLTGYSPFRHVIPIVVFALLSGLILLKSRKESQTDPIKLSCLFTFAFFFSTYVFTPQMNLVLVPFFVLGALKEGYLEFLAFDLLNSLVILLGFSQPLLILGITLNYPQFGLTSPIQWFAIERSIWVGKMLVNGLLRRV